MLLALATLSSIKPWVIRVGPGLLIAPVPVRCFSVTFKENVVFRLKVN